MGEDPHDDKGERKYGKPIFFPKTERRKKHRFYIRHMGENYAPPDHKKKGRPGRPKASTHGVPRQDNNQAKEGEAMSDGTKESCHWCDEECVEGICTNCAHNNREDQ